MSFGNYVDNESEGETNDKDLYKFDLKNKDE